MESFLRRWSLLFLVSGCSAFRASVLTARTTFVREGLSIGLNAGHCAGPTPSRRHGSGNLMIYQRSWSISPFSHVSPISYKPVLYATLASPEDVTLLKPTKEGKVAGQKIKRLKDRMWVRETLEELTSSEFACSLGMDDEEDSSLNKSKKNKNRAVDFENLLHKLDTRVEEMCVRNSVEADLCYVLADAEQEQEFAQEQQCYSLVQGKGMGNVVYTPEQREALLLRIMATRQNLMNTMRKRGKGSKHKATSAMADLDDIRNQLQKDSIRLDNITTEALKVSQTNLLQPNITSSNSNSAIESKRPTLYVRDDGTVDWEGALQDREAVKLFGAEVWSRINGLDPESIDAEEGGEEVKAETGQAKAVTAKIVETPEIREKKEAMDQLTEELKQMEKDHTKLLESGIKEGATVATVNFATLDPQLRTSIRESTLALTKQKEKVSFQTLLYEQERIFVYLDSELGNTATKGPIPLQDRLNVAEFGLLESQIDNFSLLLSQNESIDADVLSVVVDQMTDFKRRLGIDYYVTGITFDWEGIQRWLNDLWEQVKTGGGFYVKGVQLFWNDVVFCLSLISRAAQGYTLKPREVRTLRRTFKDTITFIPVIIILIIPLSPVGHVFVFGAIQRFFPDFFPSCFTERRQNLLELYESTEYSEVTINESFQEKIVRIGEAAIFTTMAASKQYFKQFNLESNSSESDKDSN
mmetsp:Transcript_46934/g.69458  ORF Transcript_46934/g.69458 Transcript_46934/m.69458 type:complete len:697 (+) Transcript_46934:227-2317(+)|eukprot:CAMPEP_0195522252 /NCGR_PEP_ID=MMETSP0794_2-20130614/20206_1 /TAXON_ID=515487 /ORGANISM="Stephanopyxis turris, Strain CCMP 815" /LENGTH=696 /DNA_ID=CAMNT_0040651961 /DNA_START=181 /DNA_END=2271 /DNA_ORIENTATION=+